MSKDFEGVSDARSFKRTAEFKFGTTHSNAGIRTLHATEKVDGHALNDWLQAEEEIARGSSRYWAWRHHAEKNLPDPKV